MSEQAWKTLEDAFWGGGGCIRWRDPDRQDEESSEIYKKGYEVRLRAENRKQATAIVKALAAVGMSAGRPYEKGPIWIVPMYGRDQVVEFAKKLKVKGYSARRA